MNIVYSMTRNVYYKILPSLRSLAEHNPDAKVYVLCEDDRLPFETPIKVTCVNISGQNYFPAIGEHRTEAFGGYINQLKVCYPLILSRLNKVIHLDIDTIITDSLAGLWNTDVTGKWFAAVPERQTWYHPYGDRYYNMGVALINLRQMRIDNIVLTMTNFLLTTDQPFADQNAWNKFGSEQDKATTLDLRYNESPTTGKTPAPAVVHYCSIPNWYENKTMDRREYLDKYIFDNDVNNYASK